MVSYIAVLHRCEPTSRNVKPRAVGTIDDLVDVEAGGKAECNLACVAHPWAAFTHAARSEPCVTPGLAAKRWNGCNGPFVERLEKEVIEEPVAAEESLESIERKVLGDGKQELWSDRIEG
jgi:hypothetical protein